MNILLVLAFLFSTGSMLGWVLEVFFRRFVSDANRERKWINPGLLVGPCLPLYGLGLSVLYLLASLERYDMIVDSVWNKVLLFFAMMVCMTAMEYITGLICLKWGNIRLWDYRDRWGNINGIICPAFTLAWGCLGAFYYFLIHPHILDALSWLSQNLVFSFFIGMFFGVFLIDLVYSTSIATKIRRFAVDNEVIVKYETLKDNIRNARQNRKKRFFLFPFHTTRPLSEHMKEALAKFEQRRKKA